MREPWIVATYEGLALAMTQRAPELIRHGHSKDQRPDRMAQLKVMLATLDPLGAQPLVTQIVSGQYGADDGSRSFTSRPVDAQARAVLGHWEAACFMWGDSKMEALTDNTRRLIL